MARAPAKTVSPERAEREILGRVYRQLREDARPKLYQSDVARRLGITTQAWQQHESGNTAFTPEKIEALNDFFNVTEEELEIAKARVISGDRATASTSSAPPRPNARDLTLDVFGRARAGLLGPEIYDVHEPLRTINISSLLGPNSGAVEVAGDSVSPWAESGDILVYDRDRYPVRGKGVIVETHDGTVFIKLYEKQDGSTLFVKELFPEEKVLTFKLKDVKGTYRVRMRID